MIIKRLPANTKGRDFICGDIHGCFGFIEQFLHAVGFDKTADRLFSVGDIIDRGRENEKCLDLLFEPWFFAVKGNHESMMERYFADHPHGAYWPRNGGVWGIKYSQPALLDDDGLQVMAAIEEAKDLPLLITVEKPGGGVFHVIHAELSLFCESLPTDEALSNEDTAAPFFFARCNVYDTEDWEPSVMWSRYIFAPFFSANLFDNRAIEKLKRGAALSKTNRIFNSSLSHIYSGHTPVKRPVQFFGQTNLDTMAYDAFDVPSGPNGYGRKAAEWCGLTFTEPLTGKFWLSNGQGVRETLPVIIGELND